MGQLTVRAIESAKAKDKPYKLIDGDGLQLRVATDGVKTWLVRYMIDGKERQYRLPKTYGNGEAFYSLQDARAEAARIRALARQHINYATKLEQDRQAEAAALAAKQAYSLTVADLFAAWMPTVDRKDQGAELRRLFGKDVLPLVGQTLLKSLTEADMHAVLDKVVKRGANRLAVMLLADLKQMFRWGERRKPWKLLIDNPVEAINRDKITADGYDGSERTRTLSANEIRELRGKLPAARLAKHAELAIWIMLSCCCRVGEISRAKWSDVDWNAAVWTIPKEHAKNGMAHTIYLSDFALSVFRQLRQVSPSRIWCIPNTDDTSHICVKSITKQIRDRQLAAVNRAPMANRSKCADALILANGDWTPHDLRRTGATMMQALGVAPLVIEKVLNHVEPNKLKRTYQTHDYADEKRDAWHLLGQQLERLTPRLKDNILHLRSA